MCSDICWHCFIFHICLYHSIQYLYLSTLSTCQCHMSLPSNNSVGVHAVFCPNTSRISAGYLSIFVSINYLFLTFLHRHDFDVLLTNLIDVSDIIVRNGRQISAVDLEWHWNARFVVGDRFIPPGRIQDLISANSPAKFIAFIKRTQALQPESNLFLNDFYHVLSTSIVSEYYSLFTIWNGVTYVNAPRAMKQLDVSVHFPKSCVQNSSHPQQPKYLNPWVPGYLCWSLSMEHRTMKTNMRGFSREHQQSLQFIESECILTMVNRTSSSKWPPRIIVFHFWVTRCADQEFQVWKKNGGLRPLSRGNPLNLNLNKTCWCSLGFVCFCLLYILFRPYYLCMYW